MDDEGSKEILENPSGSKESFAVTVSLDSNDEFPDQTLYIQLKDEHGVPQGNRIDIDPNNDADFILPEGWSVELSDDSSDSDDDGGRVMLSFE